jgi:hypothetical protein
MALAAQSFAYGIVNPAADRAYNVQPLDFRGSAPLQPARWSTDVEMALYYTEQVMSNDAHGGHLQNRFQDQMPVGSGEDAQDIDGDWNIHLADVTNRKQYVLLPTNFPDYFQPSTTPLPNGAPLQDGKYDMVVRQFSSRFQDFGKGVDDPVHNKRIAAFWIDTGIPDTVIDTEVPSGSSGSKDRTFTFHAQDVNPTTSSGTILNCRVDGGAWEECNDPDSEQYTPIRPGSFSLTNLTEGQHTFEVRANDAAGNVDPTPASSTFYVDGTAPTIDITRPVNGSRFVLDTDVDSAFTCSDPLVGTPAGNSGIKSCVGPAKIDTSTLGEHTFTVNAEDNAGNTASKTTTYFVDPPKYTDVIQSGDPIAYYRLGEPEGSITMTDSSGNGHHGELKNGIKLRQPAAPACQTGATRPAVCATSDEPQDSSAAFPERDGYGYANGITAPQDAYSIEAWIKRAGNGDGSIAGQGGGGQLFVKDGKLALRQTQDTVLSDGPWLEPGKWWHVAATWDGHLTRLYVNGEQVAFSDSALKAPSGASTFYVGYGDQAPWFYGNLDEVAYYGRALSPREIAKRFLVGTVSDPPADSQVSPLVASDPPPTVDPPDSPDTSDTPDLVDPPDTPETTDATVPPTGSTGRVTNTRSAKRKAIRKCKRIKKHSKRRKCLRRVRARY